MNKVAISLLNRILSEAPPDTLVCLPEPQAQLLADLSARELGVQLKASMSATSAGQALETHGLFGRRVLIVQKQSDFSINC